LLRTAQPKLFEFCLKLRKKEAVWAEIGVGRPFLHISGMYGPERGCIALVWPLAPHPTNKNELIVWDLSVDPAELLGLDAEQIRLRMFSKQEALPEGLTRLPIKTIHVNKSPVVISQLKTLTPAMAQRWGLDIEQGLAHAGILAERGVSLGGLWSAVFQRPQAESRPDVDEDLYGGFAGNEDRRTLQRLRALSPQALAERVAAGKVGFADKRLDEILFRYRARNHAEHLSPAEAQAWREHCAARLHQGSGGALSLQAYGERIDALSEQADERALEILAALYDYAELIAPEL
jgi:exodeoxyribonuclease-1